MRSSLAPSGKLAATIRAHWDGVVPFLATRVTHGLIEAINGLLQLAKRMARGFRSIRHFQVMTYLKAAKFKPELPPALRTWNSKEAEFGEIAEVDVSADDGECHGGCSGENCQEIEPAADGWEIRRQSSP